MHSSTLQLAITAARHLVGPLCFNLTFFKILGITWRVLLSPRIIWQILCVEYLSLRKVETKNKPAQSLTPYVPIT